MKIITEYDCTIDDVVNHSLNIPIMSWCNDPDQGAIAQAINLANLPFAYHHIALMPDTHKGYGMPIGAVLATTGVVVPNAVGVDIGCGMLACKTEYTDISNEQLKEIMSGIRRKIPLGKNKQNAKLEIPELPKSISNRPIVEREFENAKYQLGSLGSGNHFIEIQKGSDGHVWFMIHSGSRNLGSQVAEHYDKIAKELNAKWYSGVDSKIDLAFLPLNCQEGLDYIAEMEYCNEFARANRQQMANCISECIIATMTRAGVKKCIEQVRYNVGHNYARLENHFGNNVWVHRKGATSARSGEIGIIPGSQGTKSYIVEGLGNKDSFMSCSHGAGRRLSRKKAQQELSLEQEIELMDSQGIIHGIRNANDLDEASGAYKDIDTVIQEQSDLVKVLVELKPLAVIKG